MVLLLEVLPALVRSIRNLKLTALLRALTLSALFNNVIFLHQNIMLLILVANTELVPRCQSRTVQIRLVGVSIAIEGRIDGPFHHAQGRIEARG